MFARRSPLLKLQGDESLVALTRDGHQHAFEALVGRYQSRLLGFCRQMLGSTEDAEDVLQEVFVAAYNAMVADDRPIAVRPWLYRIARNRCLNHLRKPTADGQDTMDTHPHMNGVTTLERVQNREEFRNLLSDVGKLPETQRSALLLREIDAMSYEEIAQAMDTTVPGVKSLLVRARIALAESSQARQLTCDEVRLQLAEAAEGLAKLDGSARRHVKGCEACGDFRGQLQKDSKVLAALFPAGPLLVLKGLIFGKLSGLFGGGGGAAAGGAGASGAAGAGAAGAGVAGAGAAAAGGTAATGAAGALGGAAAVGGGAAGAAGAGAAGAAIGTKAAAGLATAAIVVGGAAEVKHIADKREPAKAPKAQSKPTKAAQASQAALVAVQPPAPTTTTPTPPPETTITTPVEPEVVVPPVPAEEELEQTEDATGGIQAGKPKKKPEAQTNADDTHATGGTQTTAPVATSVTPACDANGDGAVDPGTGPECAGTGASTGVGTAQTTEPTTTFTVPQKPKGKGAKKKRGKKGKGAKKGKAGKKGKGAKGNKTKGAQKLKRGKQGKGAKKKHGKRRKKKRY